MRNWTTTISSSQSQFHSHAFLDVDRNIAQHVGWMFISPLQENVTTSAFNLEISTLQDSRIDLKRPFIVRVQQDEDENWAVSFDEVNISMSGTGPTDAHLTFIEHLVEVFLLLTEEKETLGPDPQKQLAILQEYMRIRR